MDIKGLQCQLDSSFTAFRHDIAHALDSSGTSGRREYWNFTAWAFATGVIVPFLIWQFLRLGSVFPGAIIGLALAAVLGVYAMLLTVSFANLSIRRLHDAGFSAWLLLLYLIPGAFPFLVILGGIQRSRPAPSNPYIGFTPNQFGVIRGADAGRAAAAAAALWCLIHLAVLTAAGIVFGIISLASSVQAEGALPDAVGPAAPEEGFDLTCRDDPESCRSRHAHRAPR